MSESITSEDRRRINIFADRFGIVIPGDISLVAWSLPLLEILKDKVDALELRVRSLEEGTKP